MQFNLEYLLYPDLTIPRPSRTAFSMALQHDINPLFYSLLDDGSDDEDGLSDAMDVDGESSDDGGGSSSQQKHGGRREVEERKTKRPRCLIAFLTPRMAAKLFWQGVALCKLLDSKWNGYGWHVVVT